MGLSTTLHLARLAVTKVATAKAAALTVAVVVGGGTGLASVGALPGPAQRAAADVLEHVGIDVPAPAPSPTQPAVPAATSVDERREDHPSTTAGTAASGNPVAHDASDPAEDAPETESETPAVDDHPDGVTGSVESHGRGADGQRVTPSTTEMENHQSGHDSESERHHGESNPSAGAAQQSPAVTTVPSTTIVPESHSGGGDTSGSDGSDSSKGGSGGSGKSGGGH